MRIRILVLHIISLLLITVCASASPARKGPVVLTQPDGTTFTAMLQGDEFMSIKTTAEGHAIIQDTDGWWCYALYEADGSRSCSGWRIGTEVPSDIKSRSLNIPRETIRRLASDKRLSVNLNVKPFLQTRAIFKSRAIVILAQFKDIKFVNTKEDFAALLMADRYNRNGATGSAKEYFEQQFNGMVDFSFDVSDIVTLPASREYYGGNDNKGNDIRPAEMVADACTLAEQAGIDFSLYDSDNDGKVDNVFVFFAGEDEAEGADESSIWSHSWHLFNGAGMSLELNGKMIDRYACSAEMTRILDTTTGKLLETRLSGIGTFCHEFSHTFGLPDFYDTDYEEQDGWAAGLWGSTSLMDSGNQNNQGNTPPNFNVIEREMLGLATPVVIESDGKFTLSPIGNHNEFYRIDTDTENEYYLLECRSNETGTWDEFIGGSGMLLYHIDKTEHTAEKWSRLNNINASPDHQCADLIEADGRSDIFTDYMDYNTRRKNLDGIFFPYMDNNSIPSQGTPGLNFWSGEIGNASIININKEENGKISFNIVGFSEESTPPAVDGNISYEAFYDSVILTFETDRPYNDEAVVCYKAVGEEEKEIRILPYEEGRYAAMLEGLNAVKTYTVTVHFVLNDIKGSATSVSFMTKKQPSVSWPFITFGSVKTGTRGEFMANVTEDSHQNSAYDKGTRIPLKINNSQDAKSILWFFNRQPISHEGDYFYTLNESGTIEAHIYMEDGQEFILVKELKVEEL